MCVYDLMMVLVRAAAGGVMGTGAGREAELLHKKGENTKGRKARILKRESDGRAVNEDEGMCRNRKRQM